MNVDDPRLTAYALGDLSEPEREEIEKLLSDSLEAQQFVNETQEFAALLRSDYRGEGVAAAEKPANLIDIRDDPWFWSVARPLAIAALITVLAVVGAITVAKYKSRSSANEASAFNLAIEGEEKPQSGATTQFAGPETLRNPLHPNLIRRIEHVVIGEVEMASNDGEIRVIETIADGYRIERLKERLGTPVLSKKTQVSSAGRAYQLMFTDHDGHVVAAASFCRNSDSGFVLQPSKHGYERDGHYFIGRGAIVLPGDWESGVDYFAYGIPFPDWIECIGYSPGA